MSHTGPDGLAVEPELRKVMFLDPFIRHEQYLFLYAHRERDIAGESLAFSRLGRVYGKVRLHASTHILIFAVGNLASRVSPCCKVGKQDVRT